MKKRLFALLMAFVVMASTVVFAGEKTEETPPHDPTTTLTEEQIELNILKEYQAAVANTRYNLAMFSGESFETTGRIPETSDAVPLYKAEFPVKVVDQNGEPVHNAMIARALSGMTSEKSMDVTFRDRPEADTFGYIVTNTAGEATASYYGRFKDTTLFVFAPDTITSYCGKYIGDAYPEYTRFDITVPTAENPEPIVLQINVPEKTEPQTPSAKIKIWHNSERGADYLCRLTRDVYTEYYAQFKPGEPIPSIGILPPLPAAVTADENGLATLPQVEPGMYLLDVFVPGEERAIKRIHLTVTEGKTSTRILFLKDEK